MRAFEAGERDGLLTRCVGDVWPFCSTPSDLENLARVVNAGDCDEFPRPFDEKSGLSYLINMAIDFLTALAVISTVSVALLLNLYEDPRPRD